MRHLSFLLLPLVFDVVEANELHLVGYSEMALSQGDNAQSIASSEILSALSLNESKHQFETTFAPIANFSSSDGNSAYNLGISAKRKYESGLQLSASTDYLSNSGSGINDTANITVSATKGLIRSWENKYNRLGLSQAEYAAEMDDYSIAYQRQGIVRDAAFDYYDTILVREALKQSELAFQRSSENLEASEARQKVGLVSKVDVYRAEIARLNAEDAVESQRRQLERSLEAFHENLGLISVNKFSPSETVGDFEYQLPNNWEELIFTYHPVWLSALVNEKRIDLDLYKAQKDLLPDLAVTLKYTQSGEGDSFGNATNLDKSDWSVHLSLNSDFDDFAEKSALSRAHISQDNFSRELRALKRSLIRQVREVASDIETQNSRYRISLQQLEQAEKSKELAQLRYERGLANNLDLIDAESALYDAELNLLRAKISKIKSYLQLAYAMGVLDIEWLENHYRPGDETLLSRQEVNE